MTQDYLFTLVETKVSSICEELGYTVTFDRPLFSFSVSAWQIKDCDAFIISSSVIERISSIEHVEFRCVFCLHGEMCAKFVIDNLSLCV